MKLLTKLFLFAITLTCVIDVEAGKKTKCTAEKSVVASQSPSAQTYNIDSTGTLISSNSCVTFSVSSGTGCAWMCNYCATQLGTNNYYFTNGVCTYQQGAGCVGNPQAGVKYTCCSV